MSDADMDWAYDSWPTRLEWFTRKEWQRSGVPVIKIRHTLM